MGIMTRMLRLCKADLHGVMDQLEDKGLLLKQHLREMQASLEDKASQEDALTRRLGRLTGQVNRHAREMDKLERDLTMALTRDRDEIARTLIRRRRALESTCDHLQAQIAALTEEKQRLSEILSHQRLQYDALDARAGAYVQRLEAGRFETDLAGPAGAIPDLSDDADVELELLERKSALQKGVQP